MNKIRTLLFLSLFILLPNVVYASCTKDELNYFKRVEDNYKVEYKFDKNTKTYDLYLHSPERKKYTFDINGYEDKITSIYEENGVVITNLSNIAPGTIKIKIIGNTTTCDSILKTYDLELAPYNYYSEDPLCEGVEEFYLCQPTYGKEIDYDTFVSRIEIYKKNHTVTDEKTDDNRFYYTDLIINFLKENMFEIIASIIFIIVLTVTIVLTAKSIRKRRRLEWLIRNR